MRKRQIPSSALRAAQSSSWQTTRLDSCFSSALLSPPLRYLGSQLLFAEFQLRSKLLSHQLEQVQVALLFLQRGSDLDHKRVWQFCFGDEDARATRGPPRQTARRRNRILPLRRCRAWRLARLSHWRWCGFRWHICQALVLSLLLLFHGSLDFLI